MIADGVKNILQDIFVPDSDYIDTAFNNFLEELQMKFNIETDSFQELFTSEKAIEDVYADINIPNVGTMNVKVFDRSYFVDGVAFFRPFIRGFLVLMMVLYHIRQICSFFGYDAGVVAGRSEQIKSAKEAQH